MVVEVFGNRSVDQVDLRPCDLHILGLDDIYGSKKATQIKNYLGQSSKNPNRRPGFVGERHIILPSKYGWTMANYCGPKTNLSQRIARGDPGVDGPNGIDAQCKIHDIEYRNAKTVEDVREADKKLIRNVKKSSGNPVAKKAVIAAFKAKQLGEDLGVLNKASFSHLAGQGRKKKLPASRLKRKMMKKYGL